MMPDDFINGAIWSYTIQHTVDYWCVSVMLVNGCNISRPQTFAFLDLKPNEF